MGEKTVKDLMTPINEKLTIGAEQTLSGGIIALKESIDTGGLLVISAGKKPLGLLTFTEIFKAISPKGLPTNKYYHGWDVSGFAVKPLIWEGLFTKRCQEEMKKPLVNWVRDLSEVKIKENETLMGATEMFNRSGAKVLVVLNDHDLPVGLLSSDAVFSEINDLISFRSINIPDQLIS